MSTNISKLPVINHPPTFCEYANGACDQNFKDVPHSDGLFLYPDESEIISAAIEEAAKILRAIPAHTLSGPLHWLTWKDLGVSGQIIFCAICKAIRFATIVIADVTTLNLNLMFEIGYALGIGVPVIPIRDTSFIKDTKTFDQIGLIDTLGYLDFQNSLELSDKISKRTDSTPTFHQLPPINKEQPLYVVRSHLQNEGMIRLMSALKKSGLRFRSFDPRESPRLSLHEPLGRCILLWALSSIWSLLIEMGQLFRILAARWLQEWPWPPVKEFLCCRKLILEPRLISQSTIGMLCVLIGMQRQSLIFLFL
jgi:hypothetical protein